MDVSKIMPTFANRINIKYAMESRIPTTQRLSEFVVFVV